MTKFLAVAILAALSNFARADESKVVAADDYSECVTNNMGFDPIRIGPKGDLDIKDPKSTTVVRKDNSTEIVEYKVPTIGGVHVSRFTLKKQDGRPSSMETDYSVRDRETGKEVKFTGPFGKLPKYTMVKNFGYEGKKCHISQEGSKQGKGKLNLFYDRELCKDIQPMIEKFGQDKIYQCMSLVEQMKGAISNAEKRIAKEGAVLAPLQPGNESMGQNAGNNVMFVATGCIWRNMSQSKTGGTAFVPAGFGAGMGGGFGAGMGGGQAFGAGMGEPASNPAQ